MSKVQAPLALDNTYDVGYGGRPQVWREVYVGKKQ
jgi:hypothetical protein